MLKHIKRSFKDTIIYGLGNIAVKIVGLVLIPVFTNPKYFTTDRFGVLGVMEIIGVVLTAMLASGLPQSLTRWYWDKDHVSHQSGIFFMSFMSQIVISILFCIVLIPFSGVLSSVIFSTTEWSEVLKYVILASALQAINNVVNTLMRLQSRSLLYTIMNISKLIIVLLLTLYFILSLKMGLDGYYLAMVIGNGIIVLVSLVYSVRNMSVFFDKGIFMSMNSYGFPLLLANISAALLSVIDRFSLNSMTVLKSVALYTLAVKITNFIKLVLVDSIKLAVGPIMIKHMDAPDNKRFYSKVLLYSSYVVMFAIIVISLFSYEIVKVIATSKVYWGAVVIMPLLSLQFFFVNMKEVTVYGLHIAKKTRIIGFIVVVSAIINLALNVLLIPIWDISGAALAILVSQLFYWYACHYYSQKAFYVPYEIGKITIMFVVGTILSFSGLLLNGINPFLRIMIKLALTASFPFILYILNFYEPIEIQTIKGLFNKWKNLKNLGSNINSLKGMTIDL